MACGLAGCVTPEPRLEERHLLANLELPDGGGRLYYRDLSPALAQRLSPAVASVRSAVGALLGFAPPRAELVLYVQERASLEAVRMTRCELVRGDLGWEIVFAHAYQEAAEVELLAVTGHELAEATVLLRVTTLDPHSRWIHDGIGDLVEHELLVALRPQAALDSVRKARLLVEDQLGEGALWIDLTRWRQLAPYVIRSHRFLGDGQGNLSLDDVQSSLARVRAATRTSTDPQQAAALSELEAILVRARLLEERGYASGEARGATPQRGDLLGYALSCTYWLELERRSPGTIRRFLALLEERRDQGDHVLSGAEAQEALRQVLGAPPPPLAHYPLERALSVLETEELRLLEALRAEAPGEE